MKKIYYNICSEYMKYHKLVLSIICSKCWNERESVEILRIYNYFKNVSKENISQELRLKEVRF